MAVREKFSSRAKHECHPTDPLSLEGEGWGEGDDSNIQSKRAEREVHGRRAPSLVETS